MGSIFWKRAIFTLALIPVVFFGLPIGVFGFAIGKAYILNNRILSEYDHEFHKIPHPPNTSLVASERRVTRPTGNGSHCFYFVGEVRLFSGDRSSIEAFYADKQVHFQFLDNHELNTGYPYGLNQLSKWRLFQTDGDEDFYLIYTLNTRIDDYNSFDLRCS